MISPRVTPIPRSKTRPTMKPVLSQLVALGGVVVSVSSRVGITVRLVSVCDGGEEGTFVVSGVSVKTGEVFVGVEIGVVAVGIGVDRIDGR